jgi:hypothetical protein
MFDSSQYYTMEIVESLAYIALGFIPTLALLEAGYRMGMKIRRRKGLVVGSMLPPTKSLLPIAFRT